MRERRGGGSHLQWVGTEREEQGMAVDGEKGGEARDKMKGTKVHNPRAILSLLKLILFLVHEFTSSKLCAIYMTL